MRPLRQMAAERSMRVQCRLLRRHVDGGRCASLTIRIYWTTAALHASSQDPGTVPDQLRCVGASGACAGLACGQRTNLPSAPRSGSTEALATPHAAGASLFWAAAAAPPCPLPDPLVGRAVNPARARRTASGECARSSRRDGGIQVVGCGHPGRRVVCRCVGAAGRTAGSLAARRSGLSLRLRLASDRLHEALCPRGALFLASADEADHSGQGCHLVVLDADMAVGLEVGNDRGAELGDVVGGRRSGRAGGRRRGTFVSCSTHMKKGRLFSGPVDGGEGRRCRRQLQY
jgi:hypothetical protein